MPRAVILIGVVAACSDSGTGPAPLPEQVFRATIDGVSFSAAEISTHPLGGRATGLRILALTDGEGEYSVQTFLSALDPGSYGAPGAVDFAVVVFDSLGSHIWDTRYPGGVGSLSLDSVSDRVMMGTFEFVATDFETGDSLEAREGSFVVHRE